MEYKDNTLSLIAKEFATNPRRIIQLLNNLSSELALYSDEFATENEALICAILILREEFSEFYKKVLSNVKLLQEGYADELNETKDEKALSFMRLANVYFRNTETSDILRVLTNTSSLFELLPAKVHEAVRTFDVKGVIEFLTSNEMYKGDVVGLIDPVVDLSGNTDILLKMLAAEVNHFPILRQKLPKLVNFGGKISDADCIILQKQDG